MVNNPVAIPKGSYRTSTTIPNHLKKKNKEKEERESYSFSMTDDEDAPGFISGS